VLPNVSSPLANAGKSVNITTVQAEPMKDIIETFRTTTLSTKDPQYRDWLEAFWIACEEGHLAGVEKQVNRGVDINATAGPSDCISQYGTGLTAAVHNNHVEVVRFLLGHGARPNQPGNTKGVCLPLHIAASLGHKLIVKILLSHGANVHAQGGAYRFALTAAAVGGDISIMKLLLDQGADLKAHDMENETALHGAVIGGHLHAVQYLVRRGLDPNVSGHQGTALELAILLEQQNPGFGADIIQYLSGDMIDPTPPMARSPEPQRPKITLDTTSDAADEEVNKEILEILQALLRASLLLSAKDGKYQDVVDLLMPPDPVDPNQLCEHDEQYGYPLHAAAANGHWKVVILLLERGAEVNLQGLQLGTALHFAAYFGHAEVMIMLLAWGAEMNSISNIEGMRATPLELAATMGHTHCMLLLLKFGADVNLSGGTAGSPLHAAASSSNSLATTQLLLSYGANVCIGNSFGMSAADVARAAEQHPTKRLLKQWGCPRAGLLTPQRFLAWAASINVRVEQQQQQQQREQVVQNLIQQYAAGIKSEQVS
jgi:ankyrin repeat protein